MGEPSPRPSFSPARAESTVEGVRLTEYGSRAAMFPRGLTRIGRHAGLLLAVGLVLRTFPLATPVAADPGALLRYAGSDRYATAAAISAATTTPPRARPTTTVCGPSSGSRAATARPAPSTRAWPNPVGISST